MSVVTVADLALVFAEAIGAGSGPSGGSTTFDYYIQDVVADVVGTWWCCRFPRFIRNTCTFTRCYKW